MLLVIKLIYLSIMPKPQKIAIYYHFYVKNGSNFSLTF